MTNSPAQINETNAATFLTTVTAASEVVVHLATGDILVKTMADGSIFVNGDLVTPAKTPIIKASVKL